MRTDVYSVGAVGFYLLTGRQLFETTREHDPTYQIVHVPPRRPSEICRAFPGGWMTLSSAVWPRTAPSVRTISWWCWRWLEAIPVERPWTQRDAEAWRRKRKLSDAVVTA